MSRGRHVSLGKISLRSPVCVCVHICVYTCVHISNWKSYLCWKMLDQAPEVAYPDAVVWGPKMNPYEWVRAVEGAFGCTPSSAQNSWVLFPGPQLASEVMRCLSSLLLPQVFVQPNVDFSPPFSRRPKSYIFNWSFSAKEQTGLLPNLWVKMSREKPSPSVLLAANENKPLFSLSQLLSLLHGRTLFKALTPSQI